MRYFFESRFSHLVLLGIRLFMANEFLVKSGWPKLQNYLNGHWQDTVYLFSDVTPVPFIPAPVAAVMGTAGELFFSALLVLGLWTRLGALGLLGMVSVIELSFHYNDPMYVSQPIHLMWALLLSVILAFGAGAISLDGIAEHRRSQQL